MFNVFYYVIFLVTLNFIFSCNKHQIDKTDNVQTSIEFTLSDEQISNAIEVEPNVFIDSNKYVLFEIIENANPNNASIVINIIAMTNFNGITDSAEVTNVALYPPTQLLRAYLDKRSVKHLVTAQGSIKLYLKFTVLNIHESESREGLFLKCRLSY